MLKNLIDKIKSYDYKELEIEQGWRERKPNYNVNNDQQEEKIKEKKVTGCYIDGQYFKTQNAAADHLGVNRETFRDYLNGRRSKPDYFRKLKIKKA